MSLQIVCAIEGLSCKKKKRREMLNYYYVECGRIHFIFNGKRIFENAYAFALALILHPKQIVLLFDYYYYYYYLLI